MEDNQLEKRLKQLGDAYESIPTNTDYDRLAKVVIRETKPVKKWAFPYVASLIGVGIIVGILLMGILQNTKEDNLHSENPNDTVVPPDKEKKSNENAYRLKSYEELERYFEKKVAETSERLGYTDFKDSDLVNEIRSRIVSLKEQEDLKTEEQVLESIQATKEEVDYFLTAPSYYLEKLSSNLESEEQEVLFYDYMSQMKRLQSILHNKISAIFSNEDMSDIVSIVAKMNEGLYHGSDEATRFVKALKESGYSFSTKEGFLELNINYISIADKIGASAGQEITQYLNLKIDQPQLNDGSYSGSWHEIGDYLLLSEETILGMEEGVLKEELKHDYRLFFAIYLLGLPNDPVFDWNGKMNEDIKHAWGEMEGDSTSQTAQSAITFITPLKENEWKKPAEFETSEVPYPEFSISDGVSNNQNQEIIEEPILPLSTQLQSKYDEFQASSKEEILNGLSAFDVMRLYFHAENEKDYGTQYDLLNKPDDFVSKEKYIEESSNPLFNGPSSIEGYRYAKEYWMDGEMVGIELFYSNGEQSKVFQMDEVNGVWKVQIMPFQ
ncbi:hypothetical protein [Peribacillus alkalitolerans]|uniref:hypothetical protein n=1 Tax=Peribacillus alkalitolerans TaxID=1550385 RepID=UPI0013D82644|nr:hypothetical protein [Peribacillus alkalitolerans]